MKTYRSSFLGLIFLGGSKFKSFKGPEHIDLIQKKGNSEVAKKKLGNHKN